MTRTVSIQVLKDNLLEPNATKTLIFTPRSFTQWLEAKDYAFIQQTNTKDNVIIYANTFSDLIPNRIYKTIPRTLHNIRVGLDANTSRTIDDMSKVITKNLSDSTKTIEKEVNEIGGKMTDVGDFAKKLFLDGTISLITILLTYIILFILYSVFKLLFTHTEQVKRSNWK